MMVGSSAKNEFEWLHKCVKYKMLNFTALTVQRYQMGAVKEGVRSNDVKEAL